MPKKPFSKKSSQESSETSQNYMNPTSRTIDKSNANLDQRKLQTPRKLTITLALDEGIMRELKKDSEFDRTSVNSKINSVLEKYTVFWKYAELLNSVVIPQTQFQSLLQLMDEEQLIEIMKADGNANVLSVCSNLGIAPTLDNLIKYCFSRVIRWSGAYTSFTHYFDGEGYPCLVFEHKFGIKWSRVIAETISDAIHVILEYPTEKKIMPATVVLRVMERHTAMNDDRPR